MPDDVIRLLEAQIREARARGAFDDLPGRGKPLPPDDLAGLTPEQRFDALLLRSCGEAAPAVALLREIRAAQAQLAACATESERDTLRAVLREKAAEVSRLVRAK